jgi:polygalacturonase
MVLQVENLLTYYKNKKINTVKEKPIIFIVSASSGSGKGMLMESIRDVFADDEIKITTKIAKRYPKQSDRRDGMIAIGENEDIDSKYDLRWTFHKGEFHNGTEYVFRITALDGDGYESGYSNEVEGTPLYKGPVWYVDDGGSSSGEGSSNDPMREIQDAIDAAASGDTVLVLPGTYDRSGDQELQFVTPSYTAKNIVLKSRDGAATTRLDGEGSKTLFEIVIMRGIVNIR